MEIRQLKGLGVCGTNCYIIVSDKGNAVLIDAPEGSGEILSALGDASLKKIILTHGHFDHIFSAGEISEKTGAEVYIHENDISKLKDGRLNLSLTFGVDDSFKKVENAISFSDGDTISLDELDFKILHTPGHTSGSVCIFLCENIFTGDTLFCKSRGRTDLVDANHNDMVQSLKKLMDYEGKYDDYNIYSGHGFNTTLNSERAENVYLRGFDYDDMF